MQKCIEWLTNGYEAAVIAVRSPKYGSFAAESFYAE